MPKLTYLKNVVTLGLDADRCTGCGMCVAVCPREVLRLEDGRARIIDRDACIECGACAKNCPPQALSVEAGVGCAVAIARGALTGAEPSCGCEAEESGCC